MGGWASYSASRTMTGLSSPPSRRSERGREVRSSWGDGPREAVQMGNIYNKGCAPELEGRKDCRISKVPLAGAWGRDQNWIFAEEAISTG